MVNLQRSINPKAMALILNALVLPGLGQLYLKKKIKGLLFSCLSLLIVIAGFTRYMSVLFAMANLPRYSTKRMEIFSLFGKAWKLDEKILLAFLAALILTWLLSILDILLEKRSTHEI